MTQPDTCRWEEEEEEEETEETEGGLGCRRGGDPTLSGEQKHLQLHSHLIHVCSLCIYISPAAVGVFNSVRNSNVGHFLLHLTDNHNHDELQISQSELSFKSTKRKRPRPSKCLKLRAKI